MASRSRPIKLYVTSEMQVSCAANKRYAVVQIVPKVQRPRFGSNYRAKVMFHSDDHRAVVEWVRWQPGQRREYSYVYELEFGRCLWENTATEWPTLEQVLLNYKSSKED